ncbi:MULTISPECIES: multidrug effflux MFS transporter [unclassified Pseudodesulfovibrio]|uniref:multidrug effflux MFS transporter n=1 Tax=unclassified Pseudodesulfovibrio TaxID=2661612 RepID=UPI000FEC13F6|nr:MULTISPECIES: multidrug effflux MFS transporter [unclassified Pseudodesulfovibrio]MCJ2162975.1 multidrug effflux MFS transporter [Pseudodesulfovibrio sp. S3-i]RWU06973.1 MFS transporter [Pseudodesulfovibrio sp. S3]
MPNLILLALLAAFPPLSTDMYLPAIPALQASWGISFATANLSLVLFMATFSVCLLIHGPLSDRFGRRPVLIYGILLFIAGTILCAVSNSIFTLLVGRCVQAAGAAAASSLALALSKDLYSGPERQKILAYIGVIMALAPMLAPTLGGLMLKFASWRYIFVVQVLLALIGLYGVYRLEEPLTEFTQGGILSMAGRYVTVMKNLPFMGLSAGFAMMSLPHFGFIGGSTDIYINGFGISEQMFGLYFGFNALGFMLGSFVCTRLVGVYKPLNMLYFTLFAFFGAGVLMLFMGGHSPVAVAIPMVCISFCVGFSRPISNSMILDQVDKDVGAASGILTFEIFFVAAVSMQLISLEWDAKPMVLGWLALSSAVVPFVALQAIKKRCRF